MGNETPRPHSTWKPCCLHGGAIDLPAILCIAEGLEHQPRVTESEFLDFKGAETTVTAVPGFHMLGKGP